MAKRIGNQPHIPYEQRQASDNPAIVSFLEALEASYASDAAWKTAAGYARSSPDADDEITRLLARVIREDIEKGRTPEELSRTFEFTRRGQLMREFAGSLPLNVPKSETIIALKKLFALAAVSEKDIASHHYEVIASPDWNPYAFKPRENKEQLFEVNPASVSTLFRLPLPMVAASALYNPRTDHPADPCLPLEYGRMLRAARILARELDCTVKDVLRAARLAAMQISAWRFDAQVVNDTPPRKDQVGGEYFIRVAQRANTLLAQLRADDVWEKRLFAKADQAFAPQYV